MCTLPTCRDMARGLRRWLKKAGVDRPQLHESSTVSKQLRWHDLRATGATWLAVEGKGPTEIRDIAGHTQTSMTDRYMRSAAILRGGGSVRPFPPLPTSLTEAAEGLESKRPDSSNPANLRGSLRKTAGRTGLEPAASGVTGRRYNQLNYRPERFDSSRLVALYSLRSPCLLRRRDRASNLRHPACKASALPLSYPPRPEAHSTHGAVRSRKTLHDRRRAPTTASRAPASRRLGTRGRGGTRAPRSTARVGALAADVRARRRGTPSSRCGGPKSAFGSGRHSASRSTSSMCSTSTMRVAFSTRRGTSRRSFRFSLRDDHRRDPAPVRREQLLLQAADGHHAPAQRELARHRQVAPHGHLDERARQAASPSSRPRSARPSG